MDPPVVQRPARVDDAHRSARPSMAVLYRTLPPLHPRGGDGGERRQSRGILVAARRTTPTATRRVHAYIPRSDHTRPSHGVCRLPGGRRTGRHHPAPGVSLPSLHHIRPCPGGEAATDESTRDRTRGHQWPPRLDGRLSGGQPLRSLVLRLSRASARFTGANDPPGLPPCASQYSEPMQRASRRV